MYGLFALLGKLPCYCSSYTQRKASKLKIRCRRIEFLEKKKKIMNRTEQINYLKTHTKSSIFHEKLFDLNLRVVHYLVKGRKSSWLIRRKFRLWMFLFSIKIKSNEIKRSDNVKDLNIRIEFVARRWFFFLEPLLFSKRTKRKN